MTLRARGPVAAEEAWERYARPARWPEWSPQITGVTGAPERLAGGVTGRVRGRFGVVADFVVDSWDERARTWSWTVRGGPVTVRLEHGVAARGSGCETWLRVHGRLPLVIGYVPLAQFALHRLVHRR